MWLVCRREEWILRNIERLILGKCTCFCGVSIRAECVRRATFLGHVVWWIFSSESDVLLVWQLKQRTYAYSSLMPFAFNLLILAAVERSRERNECVQPRHLALNERGDTVQ